MENGCPFIYGTAWKREETAGLVSSALASGFRAIDTAAQPKHYREDLVGLGLRSALSDLSIGREDLFVQTKFTLPSAQDPTNCPYDLSAPLEDQIRASVASSLYNLRHEEDGLSSAYIDCLLLHSSFPSLEDTLLAWEILSTYVPSKIRSLGISNISLSTLQELCSIVKVKPSAVHVRFLPSTGYETSMRKFCKDEGILFQGYRVLKGNRHLLECEIVGKVAKEVGISVQVALLICVAGLGVRVLTGPQSSKHMREDMDGWKKWGRWIRWMGRGGNKERWDGWMSGFSALFEGSPDS